MYSYGGSLYKKNGSLKSQLNRKPTIELTSEETYNNPHINKNITNQYTSISKEFKNEPTRRLLDLDESIEINKQQKKFTNADKIRAMTDEQLANFICEITTYCNIHDCNSCKFGKYGVCNVKTQLKWLKEEAMNEKE